MMAARPAPPYNGSRAPGSRQPVEVIGVLLLLLMVEGCASPAPRAAGADRRPLAPDEALAAFVIEPGYRIDLVAAEPLVQDPVAIAFDEHGRLYVVENRGYPDPLEGEAPAEPRGVVALLTDTTGDGRYDTRSEFATGLTYPNGIMVWDGGIYVTCAPDLLYLRDTTGDGVADERRVVLTGFNTTRTAQIRFSHPTLGLDNWIYLTSGLNGGRVTVPDRPDRPPVEFTSSDSRVHPRTLAFELTGGQGQYGLTFDDHGRRFIGSNRHPVWHVVLEPHYLQRNPHLAFSETVQEVSAVGAEAVVWPLSQDLTTASFHPTLMSTPHAGTFTSASGVHIHRGDALPDGHGDSLFICEPAQNLVQRQVREPDGVTFRSRPARHGAEFLASTDTWFSPVFAANGPDGALYLVDMYRKDIDHPQYVPEASRELFDFEAGRDRGRVYRLAAVDRPPAALGGLPGHAPIQELVGMLGHRNAWRRETAQRLIVERQASEAIPLLRGLLVDSADPRARLHALWTLDGLSALTGSDVERALRDGEAGVRENGLRLAEDRLSSRTLTEAVLALAADPDPRVRFRAALALGGVADPRAVAALAGIARVDGEDRWMRAAVLSGIGGRPGAFLEAFSAGPPPGAVLRAAVMEDLGQIFGAAEAPDRCLALIAEIAGADGELGWQVAALAGIARGLRARAAPGEPVSPLTALLARDTPRAGVARMRVDGMLSRAARLAGDERQPAEVRQRAIELLGFGTWDVAGETLLRLVEPREPAALQMAAVRAVGRMHEPGAAASLVQAGRWRAYTPQVRDAVLAVLLSEDRHVHVLLDAVARGDVSALSIAPARRTRLRGHRVDAIRQRAGALFGAAEDDRMAVYQRMRRDVLARTGDAVQGARLYGTHCAACHTFDGVGGLLGPDLSGIRNQPAEAILLHILVPDYEITPGYESYAAETRDGRTLVGRLESEAPNSLTLRTADAERQVVLRSDVDSISALPTSLMPGNLEQVLSAQDLADLIAHLKRPARR
jgi:putative membrane-bound dehydrogenase-like protein